MAGRMLRSDGGTTIAPANAESSPTRDSHVSSSDNDEDIPATTTPVRPSASRHSLRMASRLPKSRDPYDMESTPQRKRHRTSDVQSSSFKRSRQDSNLGAVSDNFFERINQTVQASDPPRPSMEEALQEQLLHEGIDDDMPDRSNQMQGKVELAEQNESLPDASDESREDEATKDPAPKSSEKAQRGERAQRQTITHHKADVEGEIDGNRSEQHIALPPMTQASLPVQSKKTKPRKAKAAYGEPDYQEPRAASPILGTRSPQDQRRSRPQKTQNPPLPRENKKKEARNTQEKNLEGPLFVQSENIPEEPPLPDLQQLLNEAAAAPTQDESGADMAQVSADVRASAHIEPPEESAVPITVGIPCQPLANMLYKLGHHGWTNGGKHWDKAFHESRNQGLTEWLEGHLASVKLEPVTALFRHVHSLLRFCRDIPKAPDFDGQAQYLRQHNETLDALILKTLVLVESNAKIMQTAENKGFRQGRKSLCERSIPLLVVLLKEAFMLGGAESLGGRPSLPFKGVFTSATVKLLILISEWTEKLCLAVEPTDVAEKSDQDRRAFAQSLFKFQTSLGGAKDHLENIVQATVRKEQAMEKDLLAKFEREKRIHERLEADRRRMRLHHVSLQAMSQMPVSRAQISDQSAEDEYARANDGWTFQEDTDLLSIIRKVKNPHMGPLATAVAPGRSVEEVTARVKVLRKNGWYKYHAEGMKPPIWCYADGQRY